MKRRYSSSGDVYHTPPLLCTELEDIVPSFKVNKGSTVSSYASKLVIPPTDSLEVDELCIMMINGLSSSRDMDMMISDRCWETQALVFLNACGNQYISYIEKQLSELKMLVIFISSNIHNCGSIHTNNQECMHLSKTFGVLDPLGGGSYPLNFLIIVSKDNQIRLKAPLKFSFHNPFEKHGIHINDLPETLDEVYPFIA